MPVTGAGWGPHLTRPFQTELGTPKRWHLLFFNIGFSQHSSPWSPDRTSIDTKDTRRGAVASTRSRGPRSATGLRTMASCRPMLPTVTPPEKNMQGSQERMYRKSGDVYLREEGRGRGAAHGGARRRGRAAHGGAPRRGRAAHAEPRRPSPAPVPSHGAAGGGLSTRQPQRAARWRVSCLSRGRVGR